MISGFCLVPPNYDDTFPKSFQRWTASIGFFFLWSCVITMQGECIKEEMTVLLANMIGNFVNSVIEDSLLIDLLKENIKESNILYSLLWKLVWN